MNHDPAGSTSRYRCTGSFPDNAKRADGKGGWKKAADNRGGRRAGATVAIPVLVVLVRPPRSLEIGAICPLTPLLNVRAKRTAARHETQFRRAAAIHKAPLNATLNHLNRPAKRGR